MSESTQEAKTLAPGPSAEALARKKRMDDAMQSY